MFLTLVVAVLLARAHPVPQAEMTSLPESARER
jgi:hypothetical protein